MKSLKVIAAILSLQIFLCSCPKNTECKATISCTDSKGEPVKGAKVKLFAEVKKNVQGDIKAEGVTDSDGKVSFIFKLPAIFDVNATVGTQTATSIIKLEEGKTVEESLTIQ